MNSDRYAPLHVGPELFHAFWKRLRPNQQYSDGFLRESGVPNLLFRAVPVTAMTEGGEEHPLKAAFLEFLASHPEVTICPHCQGAGVVGAT